MARLNEVTEMIRDIFMIGSILEVLRNLMINCINIFYGVIENPWEHLEEKVLFSFWKRNWRRDRRFMKSFFIPLRSTSKNFIKHCTLSLASFHPMGHIYWQRRPKNEELQKNKLTNYENCGTIHRVCSAFFRMHLTASSMLWKLKSSTMHSLYSAAKKERIFLLWKK